jgi:PAS domain S-box-containing protein
MMALKVKQDEALFQGLLQAAPDAIVVVDQDARIVLVNAQTERLLGYSQGELLGQPLAILLPERFREVHHRHQTGYFLEPRTRPMGAGLELYARHKDDREIPVEISLSPLETSEGLLVSSAIRDITHRKQLETELRQRLRQQSVIAELGIFALEDQQELMNEVSRWTCEALEVDYCKILELLPDGKTLLLKAGTGWRKGYVGRYTMGTGTQSLAGYTLETGRPVIAEDLAAQMRFKVPPLLQEHGVKSSMTVIIHGSTRPYGVFAVDSAQKRTFTANDVNVLQTLANLLAQAIGRKEAQEALKKLNHELERRVEERTKELRQSEERFATAFHASPAPTLIVDLASLKILDMNESFLTLVEHERHELIGRTVYEANLLVESEKRRAAYDGLRRGQALAPTEVNIRTKSGRLRAVITSAQPIVIGEKAAALFTLVDITERKETEEQLMKAVQAAVQDASWFSRSIMEKLMQVRSSELGESKIAELTEREREVLVLVARGWDNKRIATELGLASQTVHNYLNRIYEKLNVGSRAELIIWARRHGFVELE